jgi:hypothetical protein
MYVYNLKVVYILYRYMYHVETWYMPGIYTTYMCGGSGSGSCPRRSGLVATQVTQRQICSPDPDLADLPTPLAAGAVGAAALQRCIVAEV